MLLLDNLGRMAKICVLRHKNAPQGSGPYRLSELPEPSPNETVLELQIREIAGSCIKPVARARWKQPTRALRKSSASRAAEDSIAFGAE